VEKVSCEPGVELWKIGAMDGKSGDEGDDELV